MTRYTRQRSCLDCGRIESVRRDNKSDRCKPCASRAAGAKGIATIKARARRSVCEYCSTAYPGSNKRFCSRECRSKATARLPRSCKMCGKQFSVLASTLKTNASGNFCSRSCYEIFLCRTERVTGRGSQWHKSRNEALRRAPFCAICGTTKRLQVHHIIPFRLTRDNSQANLVPMCGKHHRMIETMLVETEAFGFDDAANVAWAGMLRERQMATAAKIREVALAIV